MLVPSDGAHQVFNKGRNVKISWNRFPPSSIEAAYFRVLPRYREVARAQVYRVEGLAYYGMVHWTALLRDALKEGTDERTDPRILALGHSLHSLLLVMQDYLHQQKMNENDPLWLRGGDLTGARAFYDPETARAVVKPQIEMMPEDARSSVVTCDICNADIFCRFVKCTTCEPLDRPSDFCLKCVAEQRGCPEEHRITSRFCEIFPYSSIQKDYELAATVYEAAVNLTHQLPCLTDLNHLLHSGRSDATIAALFLQDALINRPVNCHQCRASVKTKVKRPMVQCGVCDKVFCDQCIWNRYEEKLSAKLRTMSWVCYSCRNLCNCDKCKENMSFISFLPYSNRTIAEVDPSLLPLHDLRAPTRVQVGIGQHRMANLVSVRLRPEPLEWIDCTRKSIFLAKHLSGEWWPARRATTTDEHRAVPYGRPEEVMVFFGGRRDSQVGWLDTSSIILDCNKKLMTKHQPAEPNRAEKYWSAFEILQEAGKPKKRPRKKVPEDEKKAADLKKNADLDAEDDSGLSDSEKRKRGKRKRPKEKKKRGRSTWQELEDDEEEEELDFEEEDEAEFLEMKTERPTRKARRQKSDSIGDNGEQNANLELDDAIDVDADFCDPKVVGLPSKKRLGRSASFSPSLALEEPKREKKVRVRASPKPKVVSFPPSCFADFVADHAMKPADAAEMWKQGFPASLKRTIDREHRAMGAIRSLLAAYPESTVGQVEEGSFVLVQFETDSLEKVWFRGMVAEILAVREPEDIGEEGALRPTHRIVYEDGVAIDEDLDVRHFKILPKPKEPV